MNTVSAGPGRCSASRLGSCCGSSTTCWGPRCSRWRRADASLGARWQRADLAHGADHAEAAHARLGIVDVLRRREQDRQLRESGRLDPAMASSSSDATSAGMPVSIPVGYELGLAHAGASARQASGKTVSETWIASRLIEQRPRRGRDRPEGRSAAPRRAAGPGGPSRTSGSWSGRRRGRWHTTPTRTARDTEIADKALAGEVFTEPHYLRQAQRYLGHAVRVMRAAGVQVTPVSLMAHLDPRELEVSARGSPRSEAEPVQAYLDSLGERQRRDLAGVRDRLSILAESDLGRGSSRTGRPPDARPPAGGRGSRGRLLPPRRGPPAAAAPRCSRRDRERPVTLVGRLQANRSRRS